MLTAESEEVNVEETVCPARSVTPAVPSSASAVSPSEASSVVDDSAESSSVESCLLQSSGIGSSSSQNLAAEFCESNAAAGITELLEACPVKPLASSKSSTNISNCCDNISANSETLFDNRKWPDNSFQNRRYASLPSLPELCENKHSRTGTATGQSRKRKHEDEVPECEGLTFNKVPNYYTALSIPTRVTAGSAARSSSDLIADFLHNERDPSPERRSCSVYDKLPAYYSSFTNSTRYDEQVLMPVFETNFGQDEMEDEGRYDRSRDENYELPNLSATDELSVGVNCPDNEYGKEKDTSAVDVSFFHLQ